MENINNPLRANIMAGVRIALKDWEKHLREYHATGGLKYSTDEVKCMILRRILPCDDKKRLTHREFVEGAHGTRGESYDQLRMRIVDTISREEIECQAREGKILAAEGRDEELHGPGEDHGVGVDDEESMGDEEVFGLMAAIDSGTLPEEQVLALQRRIQRRGRCFNCGRPGHIAKNCRGPKRQPGQGGGTKGGGKTGGGRGGVCHNCKKPGHFARECPEPRTEKHKQFHAKRQGGAGGGPGGKGSGWRQRGQQVNSTQGSGDRQLFAFLLEEIPTPTAATTTKATTKWTTMTRTKKATTTMTTTNRPPSVSLPSAPGILIDPSHRAAPSPRTGTVEGSHIGETVETCRLKSQRRSRKSCRPWNPHDLMSQVPGQTCGDPSMQPREPTSALNNAKNMSKEEPCKSGGGVQLASRTGRSPLNPGTVGKLGPDRKLNNTFEVFQEDDSVDSGSAEPGTHSEHGDESAVDGAETAA